MYNYIYFFKTVLQLFNYFEQYRFRNALLKKLKPIVLMVLLFFQGKILSSISLICRDYQYICRLMWPKCPRKTRLRSKIKLRIYHSCFFCEHVQATECSNIKYSEDAKYIMKTSYVLSVNGIHFESLHTQAVCLKLDKVKCEHNFSSFLFSHESLKRIVKWIREFRFDHAT